VVSDWLTERARTIFSIRFAEHKGQFPRRGTSEGGEPWNVPCRPCRIWEEKNRRHPKAAESATAKYQIQKQAKPGRAEVARWLTELEAKGRKRQEFAV